MFCFDCHDIAEKIVYLMVNNNHSLILVFVIRKKTRMINKSKNIKKTPLYSILLYPAGPKNRDEKIVITLFKVLTLSCRT
jgi:hypothetical protein